MVESSGIDSAIRSAFNRAAESADSTGVADTIRSRVSAGDTGTPATGSSAPGFHGGWFSALPWVGVVVVAGVVGSSLGVGGMFGRTADDVAVVQYTSALKVQAPIASCPGGPQVGILDSNTRVLAMERSEDGQHVGVRNPADFSSVVWLNAAVVTVDSDQPAIGSLPVGDACPVVTVTVASPSPTPTPTTPTPPSTQPKPKPSPSSPPPPPADTKRPTIGTPSASKNPITNIESTTISVTASDNKGVTGVRISWLGQYIGNANMTKSGSKWVYTFTPPSDAAGSILFRMVARDAAGNISSTAEITITHNYFG